MARDADLLRATRTGEWGWRVYAWDGPWVSLGRFQTAERALAKGWERWCARPTGGRAVLHGHDLTLAFASPHEGEARAVKALYRRMIEPLVRALNECGLPCQLAETTQHVGGGRQGEDCFAFRSPNDVVCSETGLKVCGCALRIDESGALLQASIPYREPLVDPGTAIRQGRALPARTWDHAAFEAAYADAMAS